MELVKIDIAKKRPLTLWLFVDKGPSLVAVQGPLDLYYNYDHFKPGPQKIQVNIPAPKTKTLFVDIQGAELVNYEITGLKKNSFRFDLPPTEHQTRTNISHKRNQDIKGLALCTPYSEDGFVIKTNAEFETLPGFIKLWILAHELGHRYYIREINADKYALNKMLELGYTYRQVIYAANKTLSNTPENFQRVKELIEEALKGYNYEYKGTY